MPQTVWLVTTGDGSDGNEWMCHGIYADEESARDHQLHYMRERYRPDGSHFHHDADVEEWPLQTAFDVEKA